MSQIQNHSAGVGARRLPWDEQGPEQVQGLRRAITDREDGAHIDGEVAPLMAELLARIDSFAEPAPRSALPSPRAPDPARPPSPREAMVAMSRARGKLAELVQRAEDPGARQRMLGLLHVLEGHLEMKREIIMRAGSNDRA